jgi:hypothetical protein
MHRARFHRDRNDTPSHIEYLKGLLVCVSDLDKRCSFFTNLPVGLRDQDLDEDVLNLVSGT